jgi:branched-chain amino acid transport system substrate-binding protein
LLKWCNEAPDIIQTFENSAPTYENVVCDLVSNPDLAEHFTPEG